VAIFAALPSLARRGATGWRVLRDAAQGAAPQDDESGGRLITPVILEEGAQRPRLEGRKESIQPAKED